MATEHGVADELRLSAQRLVRTICDFCRRDWDGQEAMIEFFQRSITTILFCARLFT